MIDYAKLGILAGVFILGLFLGWRYEHGVLVAYQKEIEQVAKAQEAHVQSIEKQQALVTKGIENEYEAKIAAIRNYYKSTSLWNNPSSSKVSGISAAPSTADVIAAYNELIGKCAETTAQTIALQDWIKAQMGIK